MKTAEAFEHLILRQRLCGGRMGTLCLGRQKATQNVHSGEDVFAHADTENLRLKDSFVAQKLKGTSWENFLVLVNEGRHLRENR